MTGRLDPVLRSAGSRVRRLWRPMAAWSALSWGLVAVVLSPLASVGLAWVWHRGDAVVANEALVRWLLTPQGLAWLLAAGGLALLGGVLQYSGLFHIITRDLEGRRVSVANLGVRLPGRMPAVLRLCGAAAAAGVVLALPLVAGLLGVHELLLGARDINYYLHERPPEWWYAVGAAGVWILGWALAVGYLVGRGVLALPAYLDGYRPLSAALQASWRRTRGGGGRVVRLLVGTVVVWVAARLILDGAAVAASSITIQAAAVTSESLRPVVFAAGTGAILAFAVDTAVAFLGTVFLSALLTKLYYEDTELHSAVPVRVAVRPLPTRLARKLRSWLRPARALPLVAVALAASAVAGAGLLERVPEPRDVAVTAHRAGPAPAPENTLAALERSIEAGADWAEVDVQLTRDSVAVVVHDADLMRMAGDPRRIAATDYAELRGVVQRPGDGSPPAERRVARLAEFLDRARGRIGLNIELKYYGWDPRLAGMVVRTVRERGMADEVRVMSLSLGAVRQVRRVAPEIEVGYAAAVAVGDLSKLPVDFLALSRARTTPRLLRAARQRGVEVHVWTVNRAAAMAEAIQEGVDGVITDRPGLAVRVRGELRELSAVSRLLLRFGEFALDEEGGDEAQVSSGSDEGEMSGSSSPISGLRRGGSGSSPTTRIGNGSVTRPV